MMTDSSDEEHSADVPDGVSCKHGLKLQDHLHIKKEEEELWESLEVKQETDITAVTVKSEDEEEEAQWRQSEENIKGVEPATCSSAKLMKVEPNGDMSEGPEAANTDGEETDCSEDWREPLSKSEDQRTPPKGTPHNTEKCFSCDVCGKLFDHRGHLNYHTRIHTREKPFGCDMCEKKFGRKDSLKSHMSIHSREKPFGCYVCGKLFRFKEHLRKHTRNHTIAEKAQCSLLRRRQSEENIKGEPATCSFAELMKVEPNGDMSEGPEVANADGEETDCSEDWREPFSQSDAQRTSKGTAYNTEKHLSCDVCGKRFAHKGHLNYHTRIHTREKPFGCDLCEKKFGRKDSLKSHMRIHSREKPFGCDVCGKRFDHSVHLESHTRIHTGEKPFGCDICGKLFRLKGHLRNHTIRKKAQCSLLRRRQSAENIKGEPETCSFAELMKVEPNGDMSEVPEVANADGEERDCSEDWREPLSQCDARRTTSKETAYNTEKHLSCDVCGKRFAHRGHLNYHTRIHTREKPFGCDLCEKKFGRKDSLKSHMRIHSREKPFGCDVCGKLFRLKEHLKKHTKNHTIGEKAQCSLLHWRQSEENIKGEPATCSSAKLMKVEPNGDMSEGPEAANTDGEETDCSEDWREPLSQSEARRKTPKGTAHNTEKCFSCDVCGKLFDHRGHLNYHARIHTREKPFGCHMCEKKFRRKDGLKSHMSIHSREKPFGCYVCGKLFRFKEHLKKHMRNHTIAEKAQCSLLRRRQSEEKIKGEPAAQLNS